MLEVLTSSSWLSVTTVLSSLTYCLILAHTTAEKLILGQAKPTACAGLLS